MARLLASDAFSIVELVLVVGLLLLLLAIVMPALSAAIGRARQTTCLSNLRSLAGGCAAYSSEDRNDLLIAVHPTADVNGLHDDGVYDHGGATGSALVWNERVGPQGRHAGTRPLNPILDHNYKLFECPSDIGYSWPATGYGWVIWHEMLRYQSAFTTVGTSYWANAVKQRLPAAGEAVYSLGPYLRASTRVPYPSQTVLLMEMPAMFNVSVERSDSEFRFVSHGFPGWHHCGPSFVMAFCDGHAREAHIGTGQLEPAQPPSQAQIRAAGVRFDCYPDAPIIDLPNTVPTGSTARRVP